MEQQKKTNKKLDIFKKILLDIKEMSSATTNKVSCMALKKDFTKIAAFGYNGSYSGDTIKESTGTEEESLDPGKSGFIHAEINMISKFREHDIENYIVLISLSPCKMCMKVLINSGFKYIFWNEYYRDVEHLKILDELNILYGDFEDLKKLFPDI